MATHVYSSKSEIAYVELRARIMSGQLEAGAPLSQYRLADELEISITPLREAIRRLNGEGLIRLDAHRNARVAPMDPREARELFETRRALDPLAIELAAVRRTSADIEQMHQALAALLPVKREWGMSAIMAHRGLHQAIYRASHNAVLIRMLDDIWDKSDRYRCVGLGLPTGAEPRTGDFDEHRVMVERVVAQSGHAAADLMRQHIDHSLTAQALKAWAIAHV
ncbi:MAG: GntR family transcriptional regulator [Salinisphaera sp.]|jgi:DNA-binding GntR family transcriptional regulator|nr:GntR family transcriptional regulator [Salinisphaera sp.]